MTAITDYLVYILVKGLAIIFLALPSSFAAVFGKSLGRLFYKLDKRHRLVALGNLRKVWGTEKSPEQLEEIAINCFINVGQVFVEFCRFPKLNKENIDQYVQLEGWEHLEKAYHNNKGLLFVTAHFGNWELMATTMAIKGCTSSIIARPLDNPYLNELVTRNRTQFGNNIIPKKKALKELLRRIKKGETVAMLIDQSTAPNEAVLANFFGHPCYTLATPAMLALKTGCAVLAAFIVRLPDNKHKIIFTPELNIIRSDDLQHDLEVNTQRLNDIIEEHVTRYPDHWLWLHRRWKF